ncbi:MAG: exodeoxyribonuclease VII large subunit [Proteobacteria bacterium]|nr:exodeoxyribonuclease VII large subunit [Pseudomonadota bacterium]
MEELRRNIHEYTVSEISGALKRTVEETYGYVRVRGEIIGSKHHSSGHLYMSLKDEGAVLAAVCWRGVVGKLAFRPEDGLEVVATGRITTFPGQSKYQIVIEQMEPAGVGALMALLEKRKAMFAAEGLFAPERKKPIPFLPATIGVITSPTGAVIRDILHRVRDRFPVHVLVWPVAVQGEAAAGQVAEAIRGFNAMKDRPDVLIVARGGGSMEDLWAFNEEIVVRAAAASEIPLISAVGHETDTTLIDFVSDRRAPTPTAAAEMALPVRAELQAAAFELKSRAFNAVMRRLERSEEFVRALSRGLISPKHMLETMAQRLDDASERLTTSLPKYIEAKQQTLRLFASGLKLTRLSERMEEWQKKLADIRLRLSAQLEATLSDKAKQVTNLSRLLDSFHYKRVLERGFVLVHGASGVLTTASAVKSGEHMELEFKDGKRAVRAEGSSVAVMKRAKPKTPSGDQGSLL